LFKGQNLKLTLFGGSHGECVGGVMDGLPHGEAVDFDEIAAFMARRATGGALTTARKEPDAVHVDSGIRNGFTEGFPLALTIANTDTRRGDYNKLADKPRPGHADYTAYMKYGGFADMSGGGHFSARLTAPLCAFGAITKQILSRRGINVNATLVSVGEVSGDETALFAEIGRVKQLGDSVGGVISCEISGLNVGYGGPLWDGVEGRLAYAVFAVPGVKGIEFGSGFSGAKRLGSENNDPFCIENGAVKTTKNDSGGILGGITSGESIVFRSAMKPTPSIAKPQQTISLSAKENATLEIVGRHDPCIALRAVPVIEAVAAIATLDIIL
jgi:chorismate synthase